MFQGEGMTYGKILFGEMENSTQALKVVDVELEGLKDRPRLCVQKSY